MELDLAKFAAPRRVVVPVRNREFIYQKKHYRIQADDGWTLVELKNSKAKKLENGLPLYMNRNSIFGYTHHNSIIFQNFDVARRKFSLNLSSPLHFNQSPTFEAVRACVWEDGQVYWVEPNYADTQIFVVKDLYDNEKPITTEKGITPELRTLYIHHAIERDSMRKALEEAKKAEEQAELMKSIPGRLQLTFKAAGAEMVDYSMTGDRIIVDWHIPGIQYRYNSVIDSKTWMIVEAGYCLSGGDRKLNITSMVKTAQLFQEQHGHINITRGHDDPQ